MVMSSFLAACLLQNRPNEPTPTPAVTQQAPVASLTATLPISTLTNTPVGVTNSPTVIATTLVTTTPIPASTTPTLAPITPAPASVTSTQAVVPTPSSTLAKSSARLIDDFDKVTAPWQTPLGNGQSRAVQTNSAGVRIVQEGGNSFMRFSPGAESAEEAFRSYTPPMSLSGCTEIQLRINLHGTRLVEVDPSSMKDSDSSSLYIDQDGDWRLVPLQLHSTPGLDGWQPVRLFVKDFKGYRTPGILKPDAPYIRLGFRFWVHESSTIDVDDIVFICG